MNKTGRSVKRTVAASQETKRQLGAATPSATASTSSNNNLRVVVSIHSAVQGALGTSTSEEYQEELSTEEWGDASINALLQLYLTDRSRLDLNVLRHGALALYLQALNQQAEQGMVRHSNPSSQAHDATAPSPSSLAPPPNPSLFSELSSDELDLALMDMVLGSHESDFRQFLMPATAPPQTSPVPFTPLPKAASAVSRKQTDTVLVPAMPAQRVAKRHHPSAESSTTSRSPFAEAPNAAVTQVHLRCPCCGGPGRRQGSLCATCYSGIYNDIGKVVDGQLIQPEDMVDQQHALQALSRAVRKLRRSCSRNFTCTPQAFAHDARDKCTRCRSLYIIQAQPTQTWKLLQSFGGLHSRQPTAAHQQ
eukprot:m.65717 g.65717  ORF g.65717 m.65717 type:complete len:364 (+) comp12071_c0_seq2:341-1432(+)